jgi:hypothetical protein
VIVGLEVDIDGDLDVNLVATFDLRNVNAGA